MTKNLFKRICIAFLTVLILGAASAAMAYSDQMFENLGYQAVPGFHTVIVDTQGVEHRYDGVLNIATLENYEEIFLISSYRICCGDDVVMEVELPIHTLAGSIFLGWCTDATAGERVPSDDLYLVRSDQTLYARWSEDTERLSQRKQ